MNKSVPSDHKSRMYERVKSNHSGLYRVQGYLIIEFLGLNNRGRDKERG